MPSPRVRGPSASTRRPGLLPCLYTTLGPLRKELPRYSLTAKKVVAAKHANRNHMKAVLAWAMWHARYSRGVSARDANGAEGEPTYFKPGNEGQRAAVVHPQASGQGHARDEAEQRRRGLPADDGRHRCRRRRHPRPRRRARSGARAGRSSLRAHPVSDDC